MEYTQTGVNRALKDIRPRAEERARRRQEEAQRPPGTGFMSERTRAKEALRVEVNTYTGENVRKIAATAAAAEEYRILRVAAYCRVSTDDIDQLVSIEMQKNAYRDMIKANPKWKHVGTYVDDGFSGTNTEHRPAFQLMMKDAMAGKIEILSAVWIQSHDSSKNESPFEYPLKPLFRNRYKHRKRSEQLTQSVTRSIFHKGCIRININQATSSFFLLRRFTS